MNKCVFVLILLAVYCSESTLNAKNDMRCKGMNKSELSKILSDKSMTELNLDRCNLQSLMPELAKYTKLINLELFAAGISQLPENIGELVSLESLSLPKNKLKSLPASIGKLRNLKELNLSMNELKKLPADIMKLTNLKILDLSNNDDLVLDDNLQKWIEQLKAKGCEVVLSN